MPTVRLFELSEDLRRFNDEYQWSNAIIVKVLRRAYAIELSVAELEKLERRLEISSKM